MKQKMKKQNGFTLIELTVVLAILAIIAAILVPTFLITTDRARLRGDIQTARIIQNAMELYNIEQRVPLPANANMQSRLDSLISARYLPDRDIQPQTHAAIWAWCQTYGVRVDIRGNNQNSVQRALQNLSEEEKQYVLH